jgi:4a-hydroxytetrahydrobiopterin dehydratase
MSQRSASELKAMKCVPCEGGVPKIEPDEARKRLSALPEWELSEDGRLISRKWTMKDFVSGIDFLNAVAKVAEAEQHHPDVHLTGYRKVKIDLTTHAVGGLSENDFILAAKIDDIPAKTKP